MINNLKITVVLPAYNAQGTLARTYREIPFDIVDHVVLVDDFSRDETVRLAKRLGIEHVVEHSANRGYGANQKSCYAKALELESDIVVMLHPDYQYSPRLIGAMCRLIADGEYQVVFGSRILGGGALRGGMPLYKYVANRCLTFFQNVMLEQKLSEYHTGYRAFASDALRSIDTSLLSDDFLFDNQIIAQLFDAGIAIAEITCPTKYFAEASSINLRRSVRYGLGVVGVSVRYRLHRMGIWRCPYLRRRK